MGGRPNGIFSVENRTRREELSMNDVMERKFHEYLLESEKSRQKLARLEFAKNIICSLFNHVSGVLDSHRSGNSLYNPKYDKDFYYRFVDDLFSQNGNKPLGLGDFISVSLKVLVAHVMQEYEKENAHFESIKFTEETTETQTNETT